MIVVSTELVAALYVPNELTATAEAVLKKDPEWASPLIWRAMLPHWITPQIRANSISPETLDRIVRDAPELFRGREFPAPLQDNMNVIRESSCSALIAPFMSLARGLQIRLVTTDAAAIASYPAIAVSAARFIEEDEQ